MSELLDHMLHDAQHHPDVALVNGISVLLTLLEVRKGRYDFIISCHTSCLFFCFFLQNAKTCIIPVAFADDICAAIKITSIITQ